MIALLLLGVFLLAVVGAPLFSVIGAATILLMWHAGEENFFEAIIKLIEINSKPELTSIPLFTLAGYIMAKSGTPRRMVNVARAALGWMPGGLAIVALFTCAFFTAFTGASGVTIIAMGGLLMPALLRDKYPMDFNLGLITTCGSLGLLFPPSLPIIVYGIVSGAAIDDLFMAGILPGFVFIAALSIYAMVVAHRVQVPKAVFSWRNLAVALREAAYELPLPVVILGGIYGGFIAPLQAAAVTAVYALVVEVFLYRELSLRRDVPRIMREAIILVGGILIILGMAQGLTAYLIDHEVPQKIFAFMKQFIESKLLFLLILNLFLLVVGCLMDIFSAIFVVVPLIIPIAKEFGVDPVHLGIIFLANLEIGYITPPVGINLFISSFRFKEPVMRLYRVSIPYLGLLVVGLMIVTYIPPLALVPVEMAREWREERLAAERALQHHEQEAQKSATPPTPGAGSEPPAAPGAGSAGSAGSIDALYGEGDEAATAAAVAAPAAGTAFDSLYGDEPAGQAATATPQAKPGTGSKGVDALYE